MSNLPKVTDARETFPFPTYAIRMTMIKHGLEEEMQGRRLTRKAPRCFIIIRDEFGIKGEKRAAYEEFCNRFGFTPKP
jgi:hypothetical protein